MDIKPIRTESDYQATLREVESRMNAEFGTPEGERLDVLATLVEAYEAKQFPMEVADPVEAIKFQMDLKGLTVKDLEPMIGRSNRVHEALIQPPKVTTSVRPASTKVVAIHVSTAAS